MSRGMNALSSAIQQQSGLGDSSKSWPQLATISSYDQNNHAVKVKAQPSGIESNWMPLGAIGIGNGWGVAVGPQINDQVLVIYEYGDFSSGTIVSRIFSVSQQAPAVPSGEIWALHQTGSFVKLVTNGDIDVSTTGNLNATVTGNMVANVTGNVTANVAGNATISAQIASIVAAVSAAITAPTITLGSTGQTLLSFVTSVFQSLFNTHTHLTNSVGAQTNAPTQQMGSSHLTSTVKGG